MMSHFQNMSPVFQSDIKKYHYDVFRNMSNVNRLPYKSNNLEILNRGIEEGVFREDIDIDITNICMLEIIRMSNNKDLFPSDKFKNKDVVRNSFINFLKGISTKKGLDLINFYENNSKDKN
jgi:TetR/AcrR family transcriptional regulator, cholesterol catabolism regulator